jgi:hypothetical protein
MLMPLLQPSRNRHRRCEGARRRQWSVTVSVLALVLVTFSDCLSTVSADSQFISPQPRPIQYPLRSRADEKQTKEHRRDNELSNDNLSNDNELPNNAVLFGDFQLILAKTPNELDDSSLDELHQEMEDVISSYIADEKAAEFPSTDTELSYVFLGDMNDRFGNQQTTLTFNSGGVAGFKGVAPSEDQVEMWVKEALEGKLIDALSATGQFYIYSVYLSDRTTVSTVVRGEEPNLEPDDSPEFVVIASSAAGAVVCVALLAVYLNGKQRGNESVIPGAATAKSMTDSAGRSWSQESTLQIDTAAFSTQPENFRSSGASVAGSESSFTVNTEAGDSTALKSLHTNRGPAPVVEALSSESFERDLRVKLRKDMLTSSWMSQARSGRAIQMESVLKPSHFSASQEQRERQFDNVEEAEPWGHDANNGEEDSYDPSLRFESAHALGDDAFLEQPSQVRSSRASELV